MPLGALFSCNSLTELSSQVLCARKLPELSVSWRLNHPQDQRLQLTQMLVTDGQVNTESVPSPFVSITRMTSQSPSQIRSQSGVVKFTATIKCIDTDAPPHKFPNYVGVTLECFTRNIFEILCDECRLFGFRHFSISPESESRPFALHTAITKVI